MDHYQSVGNEIEAKRKAQPIAHALIDLLIEEAGRSRGARKNELLTRAVGVSGAIAFTWGDISQEEAMAYLEAAGL